MNPFTYVLLASYIGVDFNTIGDSMMTINLSNNYYLQLAFVTNGTGVTTTALYAVYTAPSAGGVKFFDQSTPGVSFNSTTVAPIPGATAAGLINNAQNLYLHVSTPEGSALTGDVYIYGLILS